MFKHLCYTTTFLLFYPFIADAQARFSDEELAETLEAFSDDFEYMVACAPYLFESQSLSEVTFPITCVGKTISQFSVRFEGLAAETLDSAALVAHMKMRAKNDLGFLNQESLDFIDISQRVDAHYNYAVKAFFESQGVYNFYFSAESLAKLHLHCHIWSAGSDYPIAVHTNCYLSSTAHGGIVGTQYSADPIEQSTLGYTSKAQLESYVKGALESSITGIATSWVANEEATKSLIDSLNSVVKLSK
jgi:hypothetical protein